MVEMGMREQQAMKPSEAGAAAQQLALRAFPAVDQNSVSSDLDKQGRVISLGRGYAGRGAKKRQFENHEAILARERWGLKAGKQRFLRGQSAVAFYDYFEATPCSDFIRGLTITVDEVVVPVIGLVGRLGLRLSGIRSLSFRGFGPGMSRDDFDFICVVLLCRSIRNRAGWIRFRWLQSYLWEVRRAFKPVGNIAVQTALALESWLAPPRLLDSENYAKM